jgi:hypothetical protein
MAYIGKTPVIGNFQVCDAITVVDAQAAYTMQVGGVNVSPESANHMLVSLNGILQAPTSSFTVSGSTITFASNLVTGDVIDFIQILGNVLDLGVPSDATVSTAKIVDANVTTAKIADDAITSAKLGTGDMTFPNGNLVFGTAAKGVYLGVTSATAANLLDDYEEGTWTPTLTCTATGFASVTYDAITGGRYIKVGSLVYITGSVKTDFIDQTGALGNAAIGGLPFNVGSNVSGTQSNTSTINIGIANSFAGDVPNSGYYQANDDRVGLIYRTSVNGDFLALSRNDFDNGADSNLIHFNGCYIV